MQLCLASHYPAHREHIRGVFGVLQRHIRFFFGGASGRLRGFSGVLQGHLRGVFWAYFLYTSEVFFWYTSGIFGSGAMQGHVRGL